MKMIGRLYQPEVDEDGFDKSGIYCGKQRDLWILEYTEHEVKYRTWFVAGNEKEAKRKARFVYRHMKFIKE